MKTAATIFAVLIASAVTGFSGTEYAGKDKQIATAPAPCPQWYRDTEFNVSVWGAYAFTAEKYPRLVSGFDLTDNNGDRYLESDHAWGGGIDAKYFFHRYFGVGVEGFALQSRRSFADYEGVFGSASFTNHDDRVVGGALGTFTLRYPIGCTRFAPYVFAGGGVMFGGGERTNLTFPNQVTVVTTSTDGETKAVGQFGGGLEVRVTPHIGVLSDFSWNVIDGPRNNFGMVRTGLNFAF